MEETGREMAEDWREEALPSLSLLFALPFPILHRNAFC